MKTVFLGGTCNNSTWRDKLIPLLTINYFNPVVPSWTPADQERELIWRKTSDYVLYTITPLMTRVYSIAEVVDDSNKRPDKTILVILDVDYSCDGERLEFTKSQTEGLYATAKLVSNNGAKVFDSLESVAKYLNS